MGLLIKVTNNATDIVIGSTVILAASRIGYWDLGSGNHVETNEAGEIQAFTISGASPHTDGLTGTVRVGISSVDNIQVGNLTTAGGFSTYLKA